MKVATLLLLFCMDSENLINHFQKIITLFSLGEQSCGIETCSEQVLLVLNYKILLTYSHIADSCVRSLAEEAEEVQAVD